MRIYLVAIVFLIFASITTAQTVTFTIPVSNSAVNIVTTTPASQVVVKQQPDVNGAPFVSFEIGQVILNDVPMQIQAGGSYTFQNAQGWPAGSDIGTVQTLSPGNWYFTVTQQGQLPAPSPQPLVGIPFFGVPTGSCDFPQTAVDVTTGLIYGCDKQTGTWASARPWNELGDPTGNQILNMGEYSTIWKWQLGGGLQLFATQPATSSTNWSTPAFVLTANYWTGSASAGYEWTVGAVPGSGANPANVLQINPQISNGPAMVSVPGLLEPLSTPASSSATCTMGQIWADSSYVYVCTAEKC